MGDIDKIKEDFCKKVLNVQELGKFLETQEQVETPIKHFIYGGIYVRQMFIPKDTLIIGKRHRFSTCNMLINGTISIYMGPDEPIANIIAPAIFESEQFGQKMGFAHTDCLFVTVHPTKETDVDKMEDILSIPEEEYIQLRETEDNKQIEKGV